MPVGAQGPKTVKGAHSDPNYVSRLLLDCVPVFHTIITPAYLLYRSGMFARGPKNYSYATGSPVFLGLPADPLEACRGTPGVHGPQDENPCCTRECANCCSELAASLLNHDVDQLPAAELVSHFTSCVMYLQTLTVASPGFTARRAQNDMQIT